MPFTNFTDAGLLRAFFGFNGVFGNVGTQPALWIGLVGNLTPTQDGNISNFVEPSGGNYARINVTAITAFWSNVTNAAPSYIVNGGANGAISFNPATAGWCGNNNLNYVVIFDGGTVGGNNPLMFGALTTPKPVCSGDTASFAASSININLN